jgi:AraC-like DNA-binding protein
VGLVSIRVVTNEVGYEDSSFFARLFRRKVGLTPARFWITPEGIADRRRLTL